VIISLKNINQLTKGEVILQGSDSGVLHLEESCFWTLPIV
jgi:hypothetical protein